MNRPPGKRSASGAPFEARLWAGPSAWVPRWVGSSRRPGAMVAPAPRWSSLSRPGEDSRRPSAGRSRPVAGFEACRCPRRWWSGGVRGGGVSGRGLGAGIRRVGAGVRWPGVGAGVRWVGVSVAGDVEGAVGIAQVLVAVRAGPHVGAAVEGGVGPAAVGLGPVMAPAQRGGVAGAGVLDHRVGDPVVAVGVVLVGLQGPGGSGAPGEHAGRVGQDGLFAEPAADLVGLDVDVLVEVDHRLHGDLGVGVAAPLPDLLGVHRTPGVLDPAELAHQRRARGDGGVGEVHVHHHLTRLAGATARVLPGPAAGSRVAASPSSAGIAVTVRGPGPRWSGLRSRVSWRRARSPTATARRTSRVSVEPELLQGLGAGGDGGVEVEGVGEVELAVHGAGAPQRGLPGVDGEAAAVGGLAAAAFGLLGHEPADRLRDEPVELGGADLVRDVGDVEVDVRGGLHRQGDGFAGDPAGPPGGQVALGHPGPDAAEPVPEFDGLAEVGLAGLGGHARSRRRTR